MTQQFRRLRRLYYVSTSLLPSSSANSVHVVSQCSALAATGVDVVLFAWRSMRDQHDLQPLLNLKYGQSLAGVELRTFYSPLKIAANLRLAVFAAMQLLRVRDDEAIITRNPFGAFILAVLLRKPLLYEVHDIESGLRGILQKLALTRPRVSIIVISQKLLEHLNARFGVIFDAKASVMHDAAPAGITSIPPDERRRELEAALGQSLSPWRQVCGYFGQFLPGRGIEIILAIAAQRPDCLFLVYGGDSETLASLETSNSSNNLRFSGHVPHPTALQLMRSVDVLLMPYQARVSIGVDGHDTGRWMSPMKMFEYMSTGVPIISSDLPVLKEVLEDGKNCLFAVSDDPTSWLEALDKLFQEPGLAERIGETAHRDYAEEYTWLKRAHRIIALADQS